MFVWYLVTMAQAGAVVQNEMPARGGRTWAICGQGRGERAICTQKALRVELRSAYDVTVTLFPWKVRMIRIFSISLGCPKNRVDTEHALGFSASVRLVRTPEKADCIFINTCGFIAPAIEESVRTIVEHVDRVSQLPEGKRPLLVVAGCLVSRFGKEVLAPDLPEVDLFLDAAELDEWKSRIWQALEARKKMHGAGKANARRVKPGVPRLLGTTAPSYAYLKISEGCRHACSFCTIPSIRGKLHSTPEEVLRDEAVFLLGQGVKELVVVAQDVTAWGRDCKKKLPHLLDAILPLPGLLRLRLMYLYPAGLDEELLSYLAGLGVDSPFVPYFDVPVQHAAPEVLSRMGRPFATNPRKAVDRIRSFFPEAVLRTSLIVGFPGESEGDFTRLHEFIEEVRFHHLGVFTYYPEEGTPAADMDGQIEDRVKSWRRDVLMEAQGAISEELLAAYTGSVQEVLVDAPHGEWPGLHTGRTWFQAPETDGITYVSGPGVRPGAMVTADIMESKVYDLVALVAPEGEAG